MDGYECEVKHDSEYWERMRRHDKAKFRKGKQLIEKVKKREEQMEKLNKQLNELRIKRAEAKPVNNQVPKNASRNKRICWKCDGRGTVSCNKCDGTGYFWRVWYQNNPEGYGRLHRQKLLDCYRCRASGVFGKCYPCKGGGTTP